MLCDIICSCKRNALNGSNWTVYIGIEKAFCDLIKSNNEHRHLNWLMILICFLHLFDFALFQWFMCYIFCSSEYSRLMSLIPVAWNGVDGRCGDFATVTRCSDFCDRTWTALNILAIIWSDLNYAIILPFSDRWWKIGSTCVVRMKRLRALLPCADLTSARALAYFYNYFSCRYSND